MSKHQVLGENASVGAGVSRCLSNYLLHVWQLKELLASKKALLMVIHSNPLVVVSGLLTLPVANLQITRDDLNRLTMAIKKETPKCTDIHVPSIIQKLGFRRLYCWSEVGGKRRSN